jgi:hypothetical protein
MEVRDRVFGPDEIEGKLTPPQWGLHLARTDGRFMSSCWLRLEGYQRNCARFSDSRSALLPDLPWFQHHNLHFALERRLPD